MTHTGKQIFIIFGFLVVFIGIFLLLWALRGSLPMAALEDGTDYQYTQEYCSYEKDKPVDLINNINPAHCHWDKDRNILTTCPQPSENCYNGEPQYDAAPENKYFQNVPEVIQEENITIRVYPGDIQ